MRSRLLFWSSIVLIGTATLIGMALTGADQATATEIEGKAAFDPCRSSSVPDWSCAAARGVPMMNRSFFEGLAVGVRH